MTESATDILERAASGQKQNASQTSSASQFPFEKIIILDVISDPIECQSEEIKTFWHSMNITNMHYAGVLPRNTVIGRRVETDEPPKFFFPFFPSHIAFPCKAGEMVWSLPDDGSGTFYWLFKVTLPHIADDVNHTHAGRVFEPTIFTSASEYSDQAQENSDNSPWNELRNTRPVYSGENRVSSASQILVGEDELIFENLISESKAANYTIYEAIPRYKKRPPDLCLEGSNNSLIALGTDRVSTLDIEFDQKSGMIDLVVGRGMTPETAGKSTNTTSIASADGKIKGLPLKSEIDKSPDSLSPQEGDPDFRHDRSRVYISQRTSLDKNFQIDNYNSQIGLVESELGDAGIALKSDKIRLIARSDIQFIVKGYTLGDDKDTKIESDNPDDWLSVTLSATTGDIILTPSKKGFLKLGGPDANKALLCTDSPAVLGEGVVSKQTSALSNTMGGKFGGTGIPGQGTWASKVLVNLCRA